MVDIDVGSGRRKRGAIAIARAFFENFDPEEDGSIRGWDVSIRWDAARFGVLTIDLSFHSDAIENDFVMENGMGKIKSESFSDIGDLGGKAGKLGRIIELSINEARKVSQEDKFEFTELNAASKGHVFLTDYEFQYSMLSEEAPLKRATVEDGITAYDRER